MNAKAEESYQIKKARKKLAKQLAEEKKLINAKTLHQMKKAISIWIERHEDERVKLPERIELFDENRHSVSVKSKFVTHLMKQLKKEPKAPPQRLKGRIKKSKI